MKNVMTGQAASTAPTLGALRCEVLAVLIGNPLFSREEQLRANHHTHECECPQRLALWLRNVQREAELREQAAAALVREAKQAARCDPDAPAQELFHLLGCPSLTRSEKLSITLLPQLGSKTEVLSIVGRLYVKALTRNGKLNEN